MATLMKPVVEPAAPDSGFADVEHAIYGVEVLYPTGWRLLTGLVGKVRRFPTKADATEAAVKAWRRLDRPARPTVLPTLP